MIWLTWRQFRVQFFTALGAFVVLGAILAYTGPHLAHLYNTSGITTCQASHGDCGPLIDNFTSHYVWWHAFGPLLAAIPLLVGVFWGAPLLARELETGTYRVAWTQSVTRRRWLATKLVIVGAASIATTGAFTLIVTLWSAPLDKVTGSRFAPGTFGQRGIVPIAYAAFAFTLGVAAGAVFRKLLPAMTATLAVFAVVRFTIQQWVRPHYAKALQIASPLFGDRHLSSAVARGETTAVHANDWIVSARVVDAAGRTVAISRDTIRNLCKLPEGDFSQRALQSCAQRLRLHTVLTVQPAHRYWPFQAWEFGIFAALTIAFVALAFWWTRRRIT
jgi:hypothetical protein